MKMTFGRVKNCDNILLVESFVGEAGRYVTSVYSKVNYLPENQEYYFKDKTEAGLRLFESRREGILLRQNLTGWATLKDFKVFLKEANKTLNIPSYFESDGLRAVNYIELGWLLLNSGIIEKPINLEESYKRNLGDVNNSKIKISVIDGSDGLEGYVENVHDESVKSVIVDAFAGKRYFPLPLIEGYLALCDSGLIKNLNFNGVVSRQQLVDIYENRFVY